MRRTKIICTIGPSSQDEDMLRKIILAGMNVARFNFSHGDYEEHGLKLERTRKISRELNLPVAVLLDTRGPEIRLRDFAEGKVELKAGQKFTLTTEEIMGTAERATITYKNLPQDVKPGDSILLDDGLIGLEVQRVSADKIECIIKNGGELGERKGVNVPNVKIHLPGVTQKDREDILFGIEQGVDYIAASFVRNSDCIMDIREILEDNHGRDIGIIAKIENAEGVENIDEILDAADGIMVARGDLGVEIPAELVPHIQKTIIDKCNEVQKPVITATQMLDSMIRNPRPTRAEVTDVANAIYDGTDAVMLSGETAAGRYPLEAVRMMTKIAESSEPYLDYRTYNRRDVKRSDHVISNALSSATVRTAEILNAKAIIVPTMHGFTANLLSNWRPKCRIIGMSPNWDVLRKMQLNWGVTPVKAMRETDTDELIEHSVNTVKEMGYIESGDTVIVTVGVKHKNQPSYAIGETNNMRVIVVN